MNIKKVLSFSAILALLIGTKVVGHIKSQVNLHEGTLAEELAGTDSLSKHHLLAQSPYYASLHFANEHLPLGDKQVEDKMMDFLENYSYENVRTYKTHEVALKSIPKIAEILESYGIPQDFKYIPLLESGFVQHATSHKGASGYWQFMPETARAFGLRVDEKVDERHDLVKSTHAAAKYILALYNEFESWTLVAAAYNVGSGSLRSAMQRQGEENYFKLKLNKETGSYVFRLISLKEIIEHPQRYGYLNEKAFVASLLLKG
jgi:membrane-bound lytic murein transglycosylase D